MPRERGVVVSGAASIAVATSKYTDLIPDKSAPACEYSYLFRNSSCPAYQMNDKTEKRHNHLLNVFAVLFLCVCMFFFRWGQNVDVEEVCVPFLPLMFDVNTVSWSGSGAERKR